MNEAMEAELDPGTASGVEGALAADELPPTDYGPWMLVTRRRGRGGGRGGAGGSRGSGSREVQAKPRDLGTRLSNVSIPVATAACVTRGGSSLRGRGGMACARGNVSRAPNAETATFPEKESLLPSLETDPDPDTISAPGKEKSSPSVVSLAMVPKEALSLVPFLSSKDSDLSDTLFQNSLPVTSKGKEKITLESPEPPGCSPILRTSNLSSEGLEDGGSLEMHQMIVDRVTSVLLPSANNSIDSDQVMSNSEEDTGGSSEEEALMEPDDSMTLVQYQSCHRKEVLSRKISSTPTTSHKKGRVVIEKEVP